jgi:hypothetical protein
VSVRALLILAQVEEITELREHMALLRMSPLLGLRLLRLLLLDLDDAGP